MAVAPKATIKIYKWRVPVKALYYGIILVLLGLSIVLPWLEFSVTFTPYLPRNAASGYIKVDYYVWGGQIIDYKVTVYDFQGNASDYPLDYLYRGFYYIGMMLIYLVLVMIAIALLIMLILDEMGIYTLEAKMKKYFDAGVLAVLAIIIITFPFVSLSMNTKILVDEISTIAYAYRIIFWVARAIVGDYVQTEVSYEMNWGPGFTLVFIAFIIGLIGFVHENLARKLLDFSGYWEIRLHLSILILLGGFVSLAEYFSVLDFYSADLQQVILFGTYKETLLFGIRISLRRYIFTIADTLALIVFVLDLAILALLLIGGLFLDARHLMRKTPFITLALPEDEIMRRHKMLPKISFQVKLIDRIIAVLAFIMLIAFIYLLKDTYGLMAIAIEEKAKYGLYWTTPMAYILALSILTQAVLALVPVRRG